ncbi:hypothetical protein [Fluoribacter gormanii]|uniref:hypothetical protein n=1 Tax=Fluoribacter gormanii TaxID=464 RepID=UPI0010413CC0|nr:hypothetical protein [Fluoribacter gormanii]
MKINLSLFDIDGSLYHKFTAGGYKNEPHSRWLLNSNKPLLKHIKKSIYNNKYDKVILGYGTNRQDKRTDSVNQSRGGSMVLALPILQAYFANNTDAKVLIEPFLMADIYGKPKKDPLSKQDRPIEERNLAAGDSYKKLIRKNKDDEHSDWVFDHSKITLMYAHAHRVALLNPEAEEITIDFYDDSVSILRKINSFFSNNQSLLPKNVKLNLFKYAGDNPVLLHSIQGNGEIDVHYDWSVRFFSSRGYYFSNGANEDLQIKTAAELKSYHEEDHYRNPNHEMEMSLDELSNDFKEIHEQQISTLESDPKLLASAYTTASELENNELLNLVKSAVNVACDNYQRWYKRETNYKLLRGDWGLFTWFRHGQSGQERARKFQNEINGVFFSVDDANAIITSLLTHPSTRFHRHSFASFLLDELRKIESWNDLAPDESNHYDKVTIGRRMIV